MKIFTKENDTLVYKLHKAVFLINKITDQSLQNSLSLGLPQFLILMAVNRHPGTMQMNVAKYLDLTEAAVSKQMNLMLSKGLIERCENPKNRREHVLHITLTGKKILAAATDLLDKKMLEIFDTMNQKEKDSLIHSLDKMTGIIHSKGLKYYCHC